jgi:hypothetical protein
LAVGERRYHEPALVLTASTVPHTDWSMPTEDNIRNVNRIDSTLVEVLEGVVSEDERPVEPRTGHVDMVCIWGCKSRPRAVAKRACGPRS